MQETLYFIDPVHLSRISDLQLLARTVVEGLRAGLHRSPRSGVSIDFAHYRPYVQGDDPRHIDWGLYARTDRLHVKEFEHETNLHCTVLLDCSASMDYGSGEITKFRYAQMLAACLALILRRQRDALGFIAYHHDLITNVSANNSRKNFQRILVELNNVSPTGSTDTAAALKFLGNSIRPRGMVILISDLLHPTLEMNEHLKSLRAQRHDVLIFQICDPAEASFPFENTVTLIDAEDNREQHAVPDLVRNQYLRNRADHFDEIARECLSTEIDLIELATDQPLDEALHAFLRRRAHLLTTTSLKRRNPSRGPSL